VKTLTAALITEKNKLTSGSPWITLLLVEVDSTTTLYYAIYPHDVTFASQTYTAFNATVEAVSETAQGKLDTLRVHVANVTRVISAYVESNNMLGKNVTVRVVHADHLSSSSDKVDFKYRVNRVYVTDQVATFELGHEDLMRHQLPRQRYLRGRCRFVYGDAHCTYPDDEFSACTKQTLKDARTTGSPFEKLNGWYVLNAHECSTFDAGVTADGYLTCANNTGAVKEWYDSKQDTAYAYRLVAGDFDAETKLVNTAWTVDGLWALFLVQSTSVAMDWVAVAWTHSVATTPTKVLALSTTNTTAGTVEHDPTVTWYQYARIVRAGNTVTWYVKAAAADAWTTLHSEDRADLGNQVRVGFTVCARASGTATTTVQWDYLRVNAGGMASCDYTMDGPNGCREHKNTLNYGGFPAIPSGRIYGI
jgi:phage-related protein